MFHKKEIQGFVGVGWGWGIKMLSSQPKDYDIGRSYFYFYNGYFMTLGDRCYTETGPCRSPDVIQPASRVCEIFGKDVVSISE